jgi:hypothetical protein
LPDLIGLGPALVVLDIHPRIARPRRLEEDMAASRLPGLTEELLANLEQIGKPHIRGLLAHPLENLLRGRRAETVSIMAPSVEAHAV